MPDATPSRSGLLTRHFLTRLIDNDLVSPDADAHKGASVGLAMLLSAGAVVTMLMGGQYITTPLPMPAVNAANYIDDALIYVTVSMLLLAIVAVVAWDGLALDTRDEAILGPLPIPRSLIVRAKLSAMAALAAAVLVALNGPPTLLHPISAVAMLPATFAQTGRLMLAHAVATGAAGLFGFCTVLAVREVTRALLGAWWPAVSARLQAFLILVLATAFLLTPSFFGNVPERLAASSDWRVAANPTMWFVSLHQMLAGTVIVDLRGPPLPRRLRVEEDRAAERHQRAQAGAGPLAAVAPVGVAGSFAVALVAFLWNARRPAARARTPRRGARQGATPFAWLMTATIARTPAVQAGFFFTLRTLARSVPHRAALAVAAAFGLALATIGVGRALRLAPGTGLPQVLLGTQTLLIACLLAGVEQAMRLPAHLPASWSVRLSWPGDARGFIAGVKRAVVVGLGVPVFGLLLIADLTLLTPVQAIAHYAVGILLLLIALEARFLAEHPLPFLTAYSAGSRIKAAPLWFLAALIAGAIVSAIEAAALRSVVGTITLIVVLTMGWRALVWHWQRTGAPREDDLDLFQPQLDEATTLKL
ncbi:MAG: hypothetical protein ABIT71_19265 [Vicinamibacteraceae bacterium]